MKFLLLSLILFSLSCGSCIFNKSPESPRKGSLIRKENAKYDPALEAFMKQATVQKKWQETFIDLFLSLNAEEAWILVSYSGYSNRGQAAIYETENGMEFYFAAANEKEKYERIPLAKSKFDSFEEAIDDLEDLPEYRRPSFDGMTYEFVHLEKEDGQLETSRIFINSLGISKDDDKAHRALVDAFGALHK